jgi:hypothetical protein
MKKVFVSYNHKQGPWVWERLVPVLRAAGCAEVFIDRERFTAGRGIKGQMDSWQDKADVSLLVLSPDYLASEYCRHEMRRAIDNDPSFARGAVIPMACQPCDLSAFKRRRDPPLWVDLTNDHDAKAWALLLRSLEADRLCTSAPHWLDVRDELVRHLRDQRQSVNLVVRGDANWRALRDHLQQDWLPALRIINLDEPATASLQGLVRQILLAFGNSADVPRPPRTVEALNRLNAMPGTLLLALLHFDNVLARRKAYGVDLFFALRYLITDQRKLVLLVGSRAPFSELLPKDHPLSRLHLRTVELRDHAP